MHTATPWRYSGPLETFGIVWKGKMSIADVAMNSLNPDEQRENGKFIVTACNSHDELLVALKDARILVMALKAISPIWNGSDDATLEQINAAISKAEGKAA